MKVSSKTFFSRMLRRVVLLMLVALVMSPVQSRKLGNDHSQTGRRDGGPPEFVVDRAPRLTPPPPKASETPVPPALKH